MKSSFLSDSDNPEATMTMDRKWLHGMLKGWYPGNINYKIHDHPIVYRVVIKPAFNGR